MAENTENTETVETPEVEVEVVEEAEAVEETVEKSDEIVETVDEVVEEAEDAVEEAAEEVVEVPADASTEDGEAAGVDVEKALEGVKTFITESFEKSAEANNIAIATVATSVADIAKATAEKHEQLNKALAEVQAALDALNGRVESVENDTAVRKSGEIENLPEAKQTTTMRKSLWGGRFLGSAEIFE